MKKYLLTIAIILIQFTMLAAQKGTISGQVSNEGEPLGLANIQIEVLDILVIADEQGKFKIEKIPFGEWAVKASMLGCKSQEKTVQITEQQPIANISFDLVSTTFEFDQVVVTGTKTFKRQTQSPVIVNIIDNKLLDNVQACNLSEGLKFQPGLRVETDCQTCNYTQLRMNGLGGGYSQILINGRPIFSPLTGLYGMEQIPTSMIERIEVVRGGGSALYGSSAIGGTVNVITKIPKESNFDIGYTYQNVNGGAHDQMLSGNATILTDAENAGISFFINNRNRAYYDHNDDNFSELPALRNYAFGANLFFLPAENQKLELSLSSLNEYRYGGEMVDKAAHLALQSEERTHDVLMLSADYQVNFNDENSSFITYFAGQNTDRKHYTGIFPDEPDDIQNHLENPPYGNSDNFTLQGGTQINHKFQQFLGGSNVVTAGVEYVHDDVFDVIEAYNYEIDQTTQNLGAFVQSDWEITPDLNVLTGMRADKHNLVNDVIFSPRISLLYKYQTSTQFRLTWGTGFRAPQAFDSDLHIAFAGGGISRISLADDLIEERSNSWSGSINYDYATKHYVTGFTLEGFYTQLDNAFYLHPLGTDNFGERFEKRNGDGSTVKGLTLELRANYDQKAQLEAGFTVQSSLFDTPVAYIDGLEEKRNFLRTPNHYGYATFSFFPNEQFNTTINLVYTGQMEIAHFAGAPEQDADEFVITNPFTEISIKSGYTFDLKYLQTGLELFGGIKNILNAYQNDFDSGKNRDSNYIYGPAAPRTFFVGLKLKSF